jgi:uncharacterized protein (DUF697 family)
MTSTIKPGSLTLAQQYVHRFTLAAMATGAIPVPGASLAIVAENAALVNAIAAAYGLDVSVATVVSSMGSAAAANAIGRAVFMEGARALGWFAGPLGVAGVSVLGSTTAGLQTWCLGQVAIAVCERGGGQLPKGDGRQLLDDAKQSFELFRQQQSSTGKTKARDEAN